MVAVFRVMLCCLWFVAAVWASGPTAEEILASEAVLDDFLNVYGDDPNQNALGSAKGVIENGKGKAYMGEGYWFAYCDSKGSTIQNAEGVDIGASNFDEAIDPATNSLHIKMSRPDTSTSSYVGFGCNLLKEEAYVDLSKMSAFTINAKGTGSCRLNFITKGYVDAGSDGEWGYFGADISLTSGDYKDISVAKADIEPAEWSVGDEEEWTWAADESKAVTKIQFDLPPKGSADISIKKITFTGMKYSDFGFIALSVSSRQSTRDLRTILTVNDSRVSYSLARPQRLSISLFNAMGCRVATLFSGSAEAGSHVVKLQGSAANGNYVIVLSGEQASVIQPVRIVK